MPNFIKRANGFLKEALGELEKGWGAVVEATSAIFIKENIIPAPKSDKDRRIALRTLQEKNGKFRDLFILDRFNARCFSLHERGFYDGVLTATEIKKELESAQKYIQDIENL